MLGKTVDIDAAVLQRRKQQRREDHSHRMIAAEQRDGDSGEAVVIGKAVVVTITITQHFVDADHARERAGYGHRQHDLFANRDAAVLGSEGLLPVARIS